MKTITIFEEGDIVYFLSKTNGFVQGAIKKVLFDNNDVKYLVTCSDYNEEYLGDSKLPEELFIKYEYMLAHYNSEFTRKWSTPKPTL